jgi:hypothetical protein
MAADIATPARGSAPAALDDEEESEVLFKGLPMSPAAADKENAGNVPQSPVQGSVAKSPPAGVRVSPASPASLFKRRPKPLEMLAAQNLMQTSSPAAAADARPQRGRVRDSWVYDASPTFSANIVGAVLGGPAFVQTSSPLRKANILKSQHPSTLLHKGHRCMTFENLVSARHARQHLGLYRH